MCTITKKGLLCVKEVHIRNGETWVCGCILERIQEQPSRKDYQKREYYIRFKQTKTENIIGIPHNLVQCTGNKNTCY
jgi:hypothetical protein